MLSSEARMDNGRNRIVGIGMCEQVSDNRRSSGRYLSFLVKEDICNPWGGMEGMCRVVVTVHDPMGLEFSLLNPNECQGLSEEAKMSGLLALTEVTVTCEWPVTVTESSHFSLRSL